MPICCVGLGRMPFGHALERLPFINAAFETRRLEIMDAGLTPDRQRERYDALPRECSATKDR